jgi:hypothetical protein
MSATFIAIPVPHVPFGPEGVPEWRADANYLISAARNIHAGYEVGGSNVTATVVKLLNDVASALLAQQPESDDFRRGLTVGLALSDRTSSDSGSES